MQEALIEIAQTAGRAILAIYKRDFTVQQKADQSPLTEADLASHKQIIAALSELTPDVPILSEESAEVPYAQRKTWSRYWLIDPLDGSSNIDVNVSIGTIFSIYRRISPSGGPVQVEDILQKGKEQIAAGYVLYGSSTMLVYTTGNGVNGFTLEPSLGEFVLSHAGMTTPKSGKIYSINEGSWKHFEPEVRDYISHCKIDEYTARYIGSLVADFHRNLLIG